MGLTLSNSIRRCLPACRWHRAGLVVSLLLLILGGCKDSTAGGSTKSGHTSKRDAGVEALRIDASSQSADFLGPDALRYPDSHYRPDKTEVDDEYTALPLSRLGIKEIADLRKDVLSSLPSEPDYRSYHDAEGRVKDGYSSAFYRVEEQMREEDTPPQFHLWLRLATISEQRDCLLEVSFRHWYALSNPHCQEAVRLGDINLNSSAEYLEKLLGKPAKATDKKLGTSGAIRVREWYVAFGEAPKRIAIFLKSDWSDAGSLKPGKYGQGIVTGDDELLLVNQSVYIWYESGWFEEAVLPE